ncbi:hypothetical protein M0812_26482 [Anaeramoeba flamelloides]|uniref:PAS domain-containing protein n=1 Tax=Anaeramoeba flamelloides TaxID=1746091 RepID=A0AAV7YEB1_9EUKA|nr:hypothetical protein M0812_26482 [Anaeramoeba flamelloides]
MQQYTKKGSKKYFKKLTKSSECVSVLNCSLEFLFANKNFCKLLSIPEKDPPTTIKSVSPGIQPFYSNGSEEVALQKLEIMKKNPNGLISFIWQFTDSSGSSVWVKIFMTGVEIGEDLCFQCIHKKTENPLITRNNKNSNQKKKENKTNFKKDPPKKKKVISESERKKSEVELLFNNSILTLTNYLKLIPEKSIVDQITYQLSECSRFFNGSIQKQLFLQDALNEEKKLKVQKLQNLKSQFEKRNEGFESQKELTEKSLENQKMVRKKYSEVQKQLELEKQRLQNLIDYVQTESLETFLKSNNK